jgi:Ca-activated chloride channel family protein
MAERKEAQIMNMRRIIATWMGFTLVLVLSGTALAGPETTDDKTLSPYFFVKSDDPALDQLPLKATVVEARISGVIADVRVTQTYQNEGKRPIEAIYIFPASTRAAVYAMKMVIGERTIVAEIRKREDARREYEAAKSAGKSASLLEQQRPNVFQMNVANILPGDLIRVELQYTELLVPLDSVYQFVYPTVVGPRYAGQPGTESATGEYWVANPYLHQGEAPKEAFQLSVSISAGMPVQDISCPSHKVDIVYDGKMDGAVRLDPSETQGSNRDFILRYRLAGSRVQTGLLLYEGKDEKFFLVMVQPPKRVRPEQIPPREYIFVVDVSGSMNGFPLELSKSLLRDLIGSLRPIDRFNVVLFAGGSSVLSEHSLPATPENIRQGVHLIEQQRGGGGTELLPALRKAFSLPKAEGASRTIVIATDGYVSVEERAFDLIREHLGDANVFPFGIGTSVNRLLIEGMARVGMGEPFVITKQAEAGPKAQAFRKLLQSPVLTGISIAFDRFEVYDVEPPSIPDLFGERPVVVFGKWSGDARGKIRIRGTSGQGLFEASLDVERFRPLDSNVALQYLWARHRIALLSDYNHLRPNDKRVEEVTRLGLTYNLLTAYTSFVGIDTQVRLQGGKPVTVRQPLPLPEGVSDLAVGGVMRGQMAYLAKSVPLPRQAPQSENKATDEGRSEREAERVASSLTVGEVIVSGGLSREDVTRVINNELSALDRCVVMSGIERRHDIVLVVEIDAMGKVLSMAERGPVSLSKETRRCIEEVFKKMQFSTRGKAEMAAMTVILKVG